MRPANIRSIACMVAAAAFTFPSSAASTSLALALIQQPATPAIPGNAPPADTTNHFSAEELDDLLGPIALYPDVLLSAVLAAAVFPDQVAAAAVLVQRGASEEQLQSQGWEDPVVAVAKVPEVIAMMGKYPDWTGALGSAFLIQSWDVMESVQRLRGIAFENGALQTTPQQIITVEQQTQHIIIAPANPTIIYVPRYNPQVIFVRDSRPSLIAFGTGVAVGAIIWGGSTNWNGGVVVWGRGGSWGWNNSNNRTNINVDNSRNTNININTPGGGGINRPGNINRPGDSTGSRPSRLPERIGNEGNRWTPDINRPGVGGSATGPGASNINNGRVNDWRANRPESRPPGSSIAVPPATRPGLGDNRPGVGTNRPGINNDRPSIGNRPNLGNNNNQGINNDRPSVGNRPTTTPSAPSRPPVDRPTALPARPNTPATRPGLGQGANTLAPGAVSRPANLPSRPAGTPTTGNRTSAFSGGPGNAAANRGATSRAGAAASAAPAGGGLRGGGGGGGAGGGIRGGR